MPKPKQTLQAHAEVRARLIGIAREIYGLEGPEAVSMRRVGRRAGYSTAALYRYFTDHDALVRAMWRDTVERLADKIVAAGAGQQDPLRRIRAILTAYAEFAARDATAFRASFLQLTRPGAIAEESGMGAAFLALRAAVAAARQWGQIRPVDPDLCAQTLWAIIHGAVALDQTIADFPFSDRALRVADAIETAIRGIAR